VIGQFFDLVNERTGARKWVDCHVGFEAFTAEFDRGAVTRIARARFAFVDDIGCIDSYGQVRALLQAAIRARVKANKWSVLRLTI
jgi:hypothetical protein